MIFLNCKTFSYFSTLLPFSDKQSIQSCNSHQRRKIYFLKRHLIDRANAKMGLLPAMGRCFSGVVTWLLVSLRQSQNLNKTNSIVLFYLVNNIYKQIIRYICVWMKIIILFQNGVLTYELKIKKVFKYKVKLIDSFYLSFKKLQ